MAALAAHAQPPAPPLEAFAALPDVDDAALSPDGARVAMLVRRDNTAYAAVFDLAQRQYVGQAIPVEEIKANGIGWGDNDHVLLWVSKTMRMREFRESKVEFGGVFAYDWRKPKPKQLLRASKDVALNASLGQVTSGVAGGGDVMMSAYATSRSGNATSGRVYALFETNLKNGRGRLKERGSAHTYRFVADETGRVYARLDHDDTRAFFSILAYDDRGRKTTIYTRDNAKLPPFAVVGLTPDKTALVITNTDENDVAGVYHMALADGAVTGPVISRERSNLAGPLINERSDVVLGFAFTSIDGLQYEFYEPQLRTMMAAVTEAMPAAAVRPVSWTDDLDAWLFYAEGGRTAGAYVFHRRSTQETFYFAQARPAIKSAHVAPVMTIEYKARDGLQIPGLLTLPTDGRDKNLPTIVMPHGGPEAFDAYGWDWMAQYFANQGYAVLQPNFRGSSGFGAAFLQAGWGQWGRAMQDDVTDGLKAMVNSGYTDPDRVCIVGWSYGGYSALAGAVFTPELYRCVVAIAPVADLQLKMSYLRNRYGRSSALVYHELLELEGPNGDVDLKAASPVNFAENVRAPVLLIHGRDDIIVEFEHSVRMNRALRRAGKDVTLVTLKRQDHGLNLPESRMEAMQAMEAFLRAHLGG